MAAVLLLTAALCLVDAAVLTNDGKDLNGTSPCESPDFCCPRRKTCMHVEEDTCHSDADCGTNQVCSPTEMRCLSKGAPCVHEQPNGLTCDMCKSLLPYLKNHECTKKCKSWWSWTQSACEYLCEELCKYAPEFACEEAGYCKKA